MRSFNRILIIGNLGGEPEVRMTPGGTKVAKLRVATNERWTDRNGQAQEHTEWFSVVLYGRVAEIAEKYLHKGSRVFIEGTIRTRKWQDREGKDRYTTEVRAFNLLMLDAKGAEPVEEPPLPPEDLVPPEEEDDIPF
jgi:single-strand DNA-binding protein